MTATAEPTAAFTTAGAALPLVALPQTELLTVNADDLPLIENIDEGIHLKVLRLDLEGGCWVVLLTLRPGTSTPMHYHTGIAEVFTLSGRWHYREYPDQPQTTGSYLYEPAGSVHTLICPESNTEDTVILVRVQGSNINFTEDGQYHSTLDALMLHTLANALAAERGLGPLKYIGGGAARFTAR